jgi:ABC-type transport system substrate-binding protein
MRAIRYHLLVSLAVVTMLIACAPATPTTSLIANAPAVSPAPSQVGIATPKPTAPAVTVAPAKPVTVVAAPISKVKRGGTLTYVWSFSLPSLDPHLSDYHSPCSSLLFDTLLQYYQPDPKQAKFELRPKLAESWTIVDPLTVELKLRKGAKFNDGTEFNASIAKWNFDRMITHPKSVVKSSVNDIKEVQVVDDYTLRLRLAAPASSLLMRLTGAGSLNLYMVSKQAFDKNGEEAFQSNPVGTGPAALQQWVRDDRVTMKKFDGYWEKGEDGQSLPYVDGYVERLILDKSVALLEFKAGSIDLAEVEAKDVASLQATPSNVVWSWPWSVTAYPGTHLNPTAGPFAKNKKLRDAASYAVDRVQMAKALGFGLAQPSNYPYWYPGMLGYDENIQPRYDFDLAKAKTLLSEAGFPTGIDFGITAINRADVVRSTEILQAMWGTAGLRGTIASVDRLVWIADVRAGKYDVATHSEGPSADPDLSPSFVTGSSYNWSNYSNPEVDKCYADARAEYDITKRAEVYKRCQKIIYEDNYYINGFMLPKLFVHQAKLKDLRTEYRIFDLRGAWLDK